MTRHYNKHHQLKINQKCLTLSLTIGLLLDLVSMANAALSAVTAQTIEGSRPYFTLGGVPLTNTAELLGFTYTNASGTTGAKATADAAVDGTIIIVDPNMKMRDIKAMVPITNTSTQISAILGAELNVVDADGDASAGNTSAIGALKAYWTKDGTVGYIPSSTEKFTDCTTYQLTIAIMDPITNSVADAAGNIEAQTTYGDPNTQQYAYPASAGTTPTMIYSATYTIVPKAGTPHACYAQPNLDYGNSPYNGSPLQWNRTKGFLLQPAPAKNFPTTGFYGAWFDLTVVGTTAASIITKMDNSANGSPLTGYVNSGDIKLKLVEKAQNVVNITLYGPRDGTVTSQTEANTPTHAFSPTSFILQDASGANIWQFTIEKWFITKNVNIPYSTGGSGTWSTSYPYGFNGNLETPNYCANLGGSGKKYYRVPTRADYSNSSISTKAAWNGTAGTGGVDYSGNHYTRTIGGGLFSEWGRTSISVWDYPLGQFYYTQYWTSETGGENAQYLVNSTTGLVSNYEPSMAFRAACVSP